MLLLQPERDLVALLLLALLQVLLQLPRVLHQHILARHRQEWGLHVVHILEEQDLSSCGLGTACVQAQTPLLRHTYLPP